jgi:hypothetical protein
MRWASLKSDNDEPVVPRGTLGCLGLCVRVGLGCVVRIPTQDGHGSAVPYDGELTVGST